ncbi:DUF1671-domain-containing protein [Saitoella complicata NRRL Y-17804]|uniref:UBZ3-type domain-containing protein n=1 Tax=Saitoella complicata (strain BCRC 22490 / CBS 7301 / JCM 7358 / NBRC 10748 / NRRL Y-17804) TaxID=698492 RepID=A0A0E9NRH4_SAICN|nr:DUF1671-domain-containing protein [Saitoella complicata NRRL Y-17804]ODQ54144.1 DUF1671-domain-containing protein [Saitoella complicata NRRL Y-17804]GAO52291.1 hypothetical protein G7K_6371-t1 [Saitoella complicata NRRL Y-17804]
MDDECRCPFERCKFKGDEVTVSLHVGRHLDGALQEGDGEGSTVAEEASERDGFGGLEDMYDFDGEPNMIPCHHPDCGAMILAAEVQTHEDAHLALQLSLDEAQFAEANEAKHFNALKKRELGHFMDRDEKQGGPPPKVLKAMEQVGRGGRQLLIAGSNLGWVTDNMTVGILTALKNVFNVPVMEKYKLWLADPSGCMHIGGENDDRGFGCGFRNAQMLLSYLAHTRPTDYVNAFGQKDLLSISEIQQKIERGWEMGIDWLGREQLQGKILGTRKWVGTTEVYTLFTQAGIKVEIVDFPRGETARQSVYEYVSSYFGTSTPQQKRVNVTNKGPLYFQHKGHSRTVVGYVESPERGLLVFDPGKKPTQFLRQIRNPNFNPKNNVGRKRDTDWEMVVKPYLIRLENEMRSDEWQLLRIEEGTGMMDARERDERKTIKFTRFADQ